MSKEDEDSTDLHLKTKIGNGSLKLSLNKFEWVILAMTIISVAAITQL